MKTENKDILLQLLNQRYLESHGGNKNRTYCINKQKTTDNRQQTKDL